MLDPHHASNGIQIRGYDSPDELAKRVEAILEQQANAQAQLLKRHARMGLFCTALVVMLGFSVYSNIEQGKQGVREVVQVLMLDHLGQQQPLIRIEDLPVTPAQSQIIGVLMTWTEMVRRISSDPQAFDWGWGIADEYTSETAKQLMLDFRAEQRQRQQQGTRVNLTRPLVLPIGRNSRSYRVTWEETAVDTNGNVLEAESGYWEAILTVGDFTTPAAKKARELRRQSKELRNIFGIVVDDVSWTGRPFLVTPRAQR